MTDVAIIKEFRPKKGHFNEIFHCKKNNSNIPIMTCLNSQKVAYDMSKDPQKDEEQWNIFKNCIDCNQGRENIEGSHWCLYGHETDKLYGIGLCKSHYANEIKYKNKKYQDTKTKKERLNMQKEALITSDINKYFSKHPKMEEQIKILAEKEFRSPEGQIMVIVRDHLENQKIMVK